jgi:hypothetical protein
MKTIKTVNVVEMSEGSILGMVSYPENKEGNAAAEERFKALIGENATADEAEVNDAIDEGHYEQGTWEVFLVHSK